jgi:hypothetical protein
VSELLRGAVVVSARVGHADRKYAFKTKDWILHIIVCVTAILFKETCSKTPRAQTVVDDSGTVHGVSPAKCKNC